MLTLYLIYRFIEGLFVPDKVCLTIIVRELFA